MSNTPKALFNISYTPASISKNSSLDKQAKFFQERGFYSMTSEYNYFTYTLNGKKCVKNKDAESYFTRTGSGLFGLNGGYSQDEVEKLKDELKKTKSVIWHGFISFDQETSKGFTTEEQAQKLLKQTFGGFLQRAGFDKKNIKLYASLHTDKQHHHHIHFAFFEKEPKHIDKHGKVGYRKVGKISPKAIDNYMVSVNMHLDEHADEYYTARDRSMEQLKIVKGEVAKGTIQDITLNAEINKLIASLPKSGRLSYNSKNMEKLRPQIDKVARLLIASDKQAMEQHKAMLKEFARIKDTTTQIANDNRMVYVNGKRMSSEWIDKNALDGQGNIKPEFVNMSNVDYFDRLKADYNARLGNLVLNMCRKIRDNEQFFKRSGTVNQKSVKIQSGKCQKGRTYIIRDLIASLRQDFTKQANFIKSVKQMAWEKQFEEQQENTTNTNKGAIY